MSSIPASIALPRQRRFPAVLQSNWRLFAEMLFLVPAYIAYQFVRGLVGGQAGAAFDNASRLITIERKLGLFHEATLQKLILPSGWLVDLWNYLYIWGHMPVIIVVAFWLYTRHRENYALFRNAFLVSGLIALIGFTTLPLAPPRYMPEFGFSDTIVNAQSYYVFQSPKIVNQYAAMPSLHYGWDLLVALAIGLHVRTRFGRLFAAIMPIVMLGGIVLTANHYFLDAAAGALVAGLGLGAAFLLRKSIARDRLFSFLT